MTDSRRGLAIGIDLGGTKIQAAVVGPDGRVISSDRQDTDVQGGPSKVVDGVVALIHTRWQPDLSGIRTVGVGVAGQVDTRSGLVRSAPNLKWRDFPLGERLERALGVPVVVQNDVRAATWGEWRHGAGRGIDDLIVLFVGTGVGGGVVSGGRLLTGDSGLAGELGHVTIVAGGRPCSCPNRGCLEAYVGGWAIAKRAREAIRETPEAGGTLLGRAGAGPSGVTAQAVAQAAGDGDPLALGLIAETGRYLGAGVVGLVHAFNPRRLVLGGGVIEGSPCLLDAVESAVRTRAIPVFAETLDVRRAELAEDAGVIGAASLALQRL